MDRNPNIKEYIAMFGVLLAMYVLCLILPSLGLVYMVVMAATICAMGMSFGMGYSLLASGVLLILNFGLAWFLKAGVEAAFSPIVFIVAISGALGAFCLRAKFSLAKTTVLLAVSVGVGIVLPIFLLNEFFIPNYIFSMKNQFLPYLYQLLNEMGKNVKLDAAATEQLKSQYLVIVTAIMPAMIIVMCAFIAFVFPFLSRSYCRKRGRTEYEYMTPFTHVKADKVSALVPIISMVLASFSSGKLMWVFLNLTLICGAGVMICGLSIVSFYLQKMVKSWFVRLILYMVFLCIPAALFLLVLLGIIDAFADLRHFNDRGDMLE